MIIVNLITMKPVFFIFWVCLSLKSKNKLAIAESKLALIKAYFKKLSMIRNLGLKLTLVKFIHLSCIS